MALIKNNGQAMCLLALVVMSTTSLPSLVEGRIMDTKGTMVDTSCFVMKHCTLDLCHKQCLARGYDKGESDCISFTKNQCCCFAKGTPSST
uniref:Predicted protein n=1 Tax=Hordeum vulgare subsp. vulgare TaxID=112509 RepID=F2EAB5_HORVV|nr:predicted protein [Hordeum vulgare subsp. vulgare]